MVPAAGLGTRFGPATKAVPKEMLPLVDKPTIQYVVGEAVAAGLDRVVMVTGRSKQAIEDHFDRAYDVEPGHPAGPVHGVVLSGHRYDTGDVSDYLRATVTLACEREDIGPEFRSWLRGFVHANPPRPAYPDGGAGGAARVPRRRVLRSPTASPTARSTRSGGP